MLLGHDVRNEDNFNCLKTFKNTQLELGNHWNNEKEITHAKLVLILWVSNYDKEGQSNNK